MSGQGHKLLDAQLATYQPESFGFTEENYALAQSIIAKYPAGKQQSALMPLLTLAQEQNANWLPVAAMKYVAELLEIPTMRAYEVATFYTMYNLKPVGKHFIEVCTTTPCWLRGSDDIVKTCKDKLGIGIGETTADGQFTLVEAECLCACANAPMIQIGQHYYEDLTSETMGKIIDDLRAGRQPKPGPQNGRNRAEPAGGRTTLLGNVNTKDAKQSESATEKKSTKASAKSTPNTPTQDEPKGRPKTVRQPAVENVPTSKEAKAGKTAKLAKPAPKAKAEEPAAKRTTVPKTPAASPKAKPAAQRPAAPAEKRGEKAPPAKVKAPAKSTAPKKK